MQVEKFRYWMMETVRQINLQARGFLGPAVERYGLTPMQLHILFAVQEQGEMKVGDLAKLMDLSSGNASSVCKKIEKLGYLQRTRDSQDERIVKISLTDKGRDSAAALEAEMCRTFDQVLSAYPQERLEQIQQGMKELLALITYMSPLLTPSEGKQKEVVSNENTDEI